MIKKGINTYKNAFNKYRNVNLSICKPQLFKKLPDRICSIINAGKEMMRKLIIEIIKKLYFQEMRKLWNILKNILYKKIKINIPKKYAVKR